MYHMERSNKIPTPHPRWDHVENIVWLKGAHRTRSLDRMQKLTQAPTGIGAPTK